MSSPQDKNKDDDDNKEVSQSSNIWKWVALAVIIILFVVVVIGVLIYSYGFKEEEAWDGMTIDYLNRVKGAQKTLDQFGVKLYTLAKERTNCYNNVILPNYPLEIPVPSAPASSSSAPSYKFGFGASKGDNKS